MQEITYTIFYGNLYNIMMAHGDRFILYSYNIKYIKGKIVYEIPVYIIYFHVYGK